MGRGWHVWSGDKVRSLQAMMRAGATPSQAAERLGVSYESARSRMKKLRAEDHAPPAWRAPPVKPPPRSVEPPFRRFAPVQAARLGAVVRPERFAPLAVSVPTPFDDLPPGRCKWPLGEVMARGLTCCGAEAAVGAYCETHAKMLRNQPETKSQDAYIAKAVKRIGA